MLIPSRKCWPPRWKPYLDSLHVCMTDATCYESHMRFPTDMKLLWERTEWLYRQICLHCRDLGIRRPRNKYADVAKSLSVLLQEEKEEGFKDKDAQASYGQTP